MKSFYYIMMFLTLTVFLPFPGSAQYGILDNSFNNDGKVITDVSGYADHVNDIIIQQDEKILLCGYSEYYDPDNENFVLIPEAARYHSDGSLDSSFNGTGLLVLTQASFANSYFNSVNQESDGKLLFFGNKHNDLVILRTNLDGTTDISFDVDGMVVTDVSGSDDFSHSMIIQSDNKLVAVGQTLVGSLLQPVVIRYLADGTLDSSFNSTGIEIVDEQNVANFIDVKEQTDGKLVVGGYKIDLTTTLNVFFLMRFDTDGRVDSSFGTNGKVTLDFYGGSNQYLNKLILQDDGKILAVGKVYTLNSSACIARFNQDGSLDATFAGGGKEVFSWGTIFSSAQSCLIQHDGKIVLTGYRSDASAEESMVVMRLQNNGLPDSTFGTYGIVTDNFGDIAFGRCAVIQPDQRLLAAGGNGDDACLARYTSGLETGVNSPSSISSFTLQLFPNPASDETTATYSLSKAANVEISLVNNLGQKMMMLYSGLQQAGMQKLNILIPESVSRGIYYCKLQTSLGTEMEPIVISR